MATWSCYNSSDYLPRALYATDYVFFDQSPDRRSWRGKVFNPQSPVGNS
jgi:hypothetical protein